MFTFLQVKGLRAIFTMKINLAELTVSPLFQSKHTTNHPALTHIIPYPLPSFPAVPLPSPYNIPYKHHPGNPQGNPKKIVITVLPLTLSTTLNKIKFL